MHSINLSVSSNAEAAVIDIFSSSLFNIALSTHFPLCTLFMTAAAAAAVKKFASKNKRRQPDPVRLENLGRLWKSKQNGAMSGCACFLYTFRFLCVLMYSFRNARTQHGLSIYTWACVRAVCPLWLCLTHWQIALNCRRMGFPFPAVSSPFLWVPGLSFMGSLAPASCYVCIYKFYTCVYMHLSAYVLHMQMKHMYIIYI